ncbi:hypothetical protein FACS1894103_1360 [Campylobacterota bacterium]|nr:hypothetical protein FACS1894103_1360 [Campylobacterota bacterium]
MIWYGFWQKLFGGDEHIDFCSKLFAALIVCAQPRETNAKEKFAAAAAKLYKSKEDQNFFVLRAVQYAELCERNELSINQLIRRCDRLHTLYPSWIEMVAAEAIDICRYTDNPLQEHLIDYIESLKKPKPVVMPEAVSEAVQAAPQVATTDTPDTQNHSS